MCWLRHLHTYNRRSSLWWTLRSDCRPTRRYQRPWREHLDVLEQLMHRLGLRTATVAMGYQHATTERDRSTTDRIGTSLISLSNGETTAPDVAEAVDGNVARLRSETVCRRSVCCLEHTGWTGLMVS
jgi:hypothetical protein